MRHLHLVTGSDPSPPPEPGPQPATQQLRLVLPGVPDRDDPHLYDDPDDAGTGDFDLDQMVPSAELRNLFDQTDTLFDGLSPEQATDATWSMYFDGDGKPRARSLNPLRAVT